MSDKNEGIFLWILEQDRKQNQARAQAEAVRKSTEPAPNAAIDTLFASQKPNEDENEQPTFSEDSDLEKLLKEKTSLEEESRNLDEIRKKLNQQAKMLSEKLVQEIKRKNGRKKTIVNELQARIGKLEACFQELSPTDELGEAESAGNDDNKSNKPALEASQEELLDSGQDGVAVDVIEEIK